LVCQALSHSTIDTFAKKLKLHSNSELVAVFHKLTKDSLFCSNDNICLQFFMLLSTYYDWCWKLFCPEDHLTSCVQRLGHVHLFMIQYFVMLDMLQSVQ